MICKRKNQTVNKRWIKKVCNNKKWLAVTATVDGVKLMNSKTKRIYETREDRLRVIANIVKEYLQIKEINKSSPKTVDNVLPPIINMVLNDKEFKKFTLDNFKVLIYYDKMLSFILKKLQMMKCQR